MKKILTGCLILASCGLFAAEAPSAEMKKHAGALAKVCGFEFGKDYTDGKSYSLDKRKLEKPFRYFTEVDYMRHSDGDSKRLEHIRFCAKLPDGFTFEQIEAEVKAVADLITKKFGVPMVDKSKWDEYISIRREYPGAPAFDSPFSVEVHADRCSNGRDCFLWLEITNKLANGSAN